MEANLKPLIPVRQIRVEDVREPIFTWYPYLPARAATLVFGRGGIGKSTMCADLAAGITTGRPFPFTTKKQAPGNVLLLSTEDEPEITLGSRLKRSGADFSRIYFGEKPFTVEPRTIRELRNLIYKFRATFVFLDPIVSYMGGKRDINKSNAVRDVMGELNIVARDTDTTLVVVGHTRKSQETGDAQDQAMGSADFVNAARSALMVDRTNDGTPIVRHAKSNYAKAGPAMTYYWDDGTFKWGEQVDEDEVLRRLGKSRPKDEATSFLKDLLSAGPVPAKEVEARAKDENIAMATLNRAKPGVAESFAQKSLSGRPIWYWRLKGDKRDIPGLLASVGGIEGDI